MSRGWCWVLAVFLASCGGSQSQSTVSGGPIDPSIVGPSKPSVPSTSHACFRGPVVIGLGFITNTSVSGVTDQYGCFSFPTGDWVTFFIGTSSNGKIQGVSLGTVIPESEDEVTVASLCAGNALELENVERLLMVANRQPDVVRGIVIDPELMTAVGRVPMVFPFTTDVSTLLDQFAQIARQADGGAHPIADTSAAREVLDAAARCAKTGIYLGDSTGRSPGSSEDDLLVHTHLLVRPPLGLSTVAIDFSPKTTGPANSATTSFSYSTTEPLDGTTPTINVSTSTISLNGSFSRLASTGFSRPAFTGSATYREATNSPVSTLEVQATNSFYLPLALQHFVGQGPGIEMSVWVYSNNALSGLLINQNLPRGSQSTDALPISTQIGGQIQEDGTIQMDPNGTYSFLDATLNKPYSMSFTVGIAGRPDAPQSVINLIGCNR
jgi:hypothetical protein